MENDDDDDERRFRLYWHDSASRDIRTKEILEHVKSV